MLLARHKFKKRYAKIPLRRYSCIKELLTTEWVVTSHSEIEEKRLKKEKYRELDDIILYLI